MRRLVLLAALVTAGPARPGTAEDAFKVIVNAQNRGSQIKRESLVTIFLRQGARWPDGKPVQAVDQSARSAVRAAFSQGALGMSLQAVQAHWLQVITSGRGTPPLVKGSDQQVIAFVRSHPAAIGYVSAGATLDASVKPLKIVE